MTQTLNFRPRAAVVGAGPNGLTAAAVLARQGWQVDVYERADAVGGAASSAAVLGEGTVVDLGAAAHPFGAASPVFEELDLAAHGLVWRHSDHAMAHPLEDRPAPVLNRGLEETAAGLGQDGPAWRRLHRDLVNHIDQHLANLLKPMLGIPRHPLRMLAFGPPALLSAQRLSGLAFKEEATRALFAGSSVHAMAPPGHPFTGAFGLLFGALGMTRGWPVAEGGTGAVTRALESVVREAGGTIHTGVHVDDLRALPRTDATILNLTTRQVLSLKGLALPRATRARLQRWRYGTGTYKIDYLLDGPVPWRDAHVGQASTVHVGGTIEEIQRAEKEAAQGTLPERPFVMVCQQQAADPSRATGPAQGKTVIWAYAHVPHGFVQSRPGQVAELIENQIERFAPGFRDLVVRKVETSPQDLAEWNPNIVGGDIAGGSMTGLQSLLRPGLTVNPYRLTDGVYLASGSTPPGAGVHGMPGAWAARAAAADFDRLH